MKKVFHQLGCRILKNKKRLIYGVLALFIGQVCFFGLGGIGIENEVFADNATQNANFETQATEWYGLMSFAQKLVYVLIYPVLIVAGKLIDNSLVYGEVFGFDAILWKLRVIVRNLANFGLGFIFIYKIFEFLIKGQKGDDIKKLLVSTLIAGVGIQASWFVMAALIDLSTMLTYGIGGLPISVLGGDSSKSSEGSSTKNEEYNPYILKTVVSVDAKDMDTIHVYLTNADKGTDGKDVLDSEKKYISECETMSYKTGGSGSYSEELIIAPKMIYYKDMDGNYKGTELATCNYFGQVYGFVGDYETYTETNGWMYVSCSDELSCSSDQITYEQELTAWKTKIKNGEVDVRSEVEAGVILLPGNAHITGGIVSNIRTGVYSSDAIGLDVDNKFMVEKQGMKTSRLNNLIDGESYVGVFTALYSSLLDAGRGILSINDGSTYLSLLHTILSLCHMLAIAIPLIVVALVFMMRIGILWMAIALSPMIILLKAFGFDKADFLKKGVFKYLTIDNLLPIIFYPAIICFAVSMSTVLVRLIMVLNMGAIDALKDEILGGVIKLNIQGFSVGVGKLVMCVLGVAITWFLVWAAVECSELGKTSVVKNLKGIATDAILSAKVVPIPTKEGTAMVGLGTVVGHDGNGGIISKMGTELKNTFQGDENDVIEQMFNKDRHKEAEERRFSTFKNALLEAGGEGWQEKIIEIGEEGSEKEPMSFSKLDDSARKKDIISAINDLDDTKRLKFAGKQGDAIKVGDNTYEFYATYPKKVEKDGKSVVENVAINKWLTEDEYKKLPDISV